MKTLYTILGFLIASHFVNAQCIVQVQASGVLCFGDCNGQATAYANGVFPITYLWAPGGQTTQTATGLCPGTYTVQITDNTGCTAMATCTISQPTPVQAMVTSYQNPSCPTCCDGYAVGSASGGTPAYSYLWNPSSQATSVAQQLCAGTYTLCATDMNGCSSCDSVTLSFANSINDHGSNTEIRVHGTDGRYDLTAYFPVNTAGEIVVSNALGEVISSTPFSSTKSLHETIDLQSQPGGMYFVTLVTDTGNWSRKLIR